MDELEQRLREDAAKIDARVPREVSARLRARLQDQARVPHAREASPFRLWAFASLSGAAAALVVVLLLPRSEAPRDPQPVATSVPVPRDVAREFPLVAKTAELTAPLEQELEALKSDIEKAREKVEDDLAF